jgi:RNA-binding protein 8A
MEDIQISLTVDQDVPMTDKKKKGRGFIKENSYHKNEIVDYESLEDHNNQFYQKSIEGWILIATGVHEEASEEDLLDLFSEYGIVKNLHLNLDRRTGYVKGYALLEYSNIDEAKAAIAADVVLLGKKLTVDFAFVRRPQASK